jgi:hypothetical protein
MYYTLYYGNKQLILCIDYTLTRGILAHYFQGGGGTPLKLS